MRLAIVALAAMFCVAAAAAPKQSKQPESIDVWIGGALEIDEQGNVVGLEWDKGSALQAAIAGDLSPAVRHWKFVPATVNGQSANVRTGLLVHVVLEPIENGAAARLHVVRVRTGAMAFGALPDGPRYPKDAMFDDVSAVLELLVEVEADGTPVVRDIGYESSSRSDRYRKLFLASVMEFLEHRTFRPEVVAGHVVRAPVSMTSAFCSGNTRWCETHAKADKRELPVGLHMAESSAVALRTDADSLVP
ncbi:energy transducer TonB [Luteimonas soli]|uniref:Energy transducer TonB n=1 Tax=Luteimonas soli TaxID=1648966 RepID=A0ABV7XP25_9GAMM